MREGGAGGVGGEGGVPGEHKLAVPHRKNEPPDNSEPNKVVKSPADISPIYENPDTSKTQVTVKPGSNDIPLDLK